MGIGRRIGAKLNTRGIETVAQLLRADVPTLRRQFSDAQRSVREKIGAVGLKQLGADVAASVDEGGKKDAEVRHGVGGHASSACR